MAGSEYLRSPAGLSKIAEFVSHRHLLLLLLVYLFIFVWEGGSGAGTRKYREIVSIQGYKWMGRADLGVGSLILLKCTSNCQQTSLTKIKCFWGGGGAGA